MRAFYMVATSENRIWTRAIQLLQQEHGWKPVYLYSIYPELPGHRTNFPEAVIHNYWEALKGMAPAELAHLALRPLDRPTLDAYSDYQDDVMLLLGRSDNRDTFTYRQRLRHYRRLLMYWHNCVEVLKPDVAVFNDSPHSPHEYVAYAACKQLGVPTLLLQRTPLCEYKYIVTRIGELPTEFDLSISEHSGTISRSAWPQCLVQAVEKTRSDYSLGEPSYMARQREADGLSRFTGRCKRAADRWGTRIRRGLFRIRKWPRYAAWIVRTSVEQVYWWIATAARYLMNAHGKHAPWRSYKIKPRNGYFEDSFPLSYRELLAYERYARRYRRSLKRDYQSRAVKPDFEQKYVYVPLHYQPERTTTPDGGVYEDQLLIVGMLSASVPDDWLLYIREHPSQFNLDPKLNSELGRYDRFYEDLVEWPNVRLIDHSKTSFEMIDNSQAVATVAGTAGWEAIVRGRPALVFGGSWYRWMEGAFPIQSVEELREAIHRIAAGYRVDSERLSACIGAFATHATRVSQASLSREAVLIERVGMGFEENSRALARFFAQALENYYPGQSGSKTKSDSPTSVRQT